MALFGGGGSPATASAAEDPCLECHGLYGLGLEGRPLWVHRDAFSSSAHGRLACSDCHKGTGEIPHGTFRTRCDLRCHVPGAAHEAVAAQVAGGPHGAVADPPCLGCHRSDASLTAGGVEALCRSCHRDLEPDRPRYPDSPGSFGFRGHRLASPGGRLPACPDCHGVHAVAAGPSARERCSAPGCHPGAGGGFGALFDHRGDPERPPWGGAGTLVLVAGGVLGVALLLHCLRGDS